MAPADRDSSILRLAPDMVICSEGTCSVTLQRNCYFCYDSGTFVGWARGASRVQERFYNKSRRPEAQPVYHLLRFELLLFTSAIVMLALGVYLFTGKAAGAQGLTDAGPETIQEPGAPPTPVASEPNVAPEGAQDQAAEPVTRQNAPPQRQAGPVAEPMGQTAGAAIDPAASTVEPVQKTTQPAVGTLEEPVGAVTERVDNTAEPVAQPVKQQVELVAEPVVGTVEETNEAVPGPVEQAVEPVVGKVENTTKPMLDAADETVKPVLDTTNNTSEPIVNPVRQTADPVVGTVRPVVDAVDETTSPVKDEVDPIVQPVKETLDPVAKPVVDPVKETVDPIAKPVQETTKPVVHTADSVVKPVVDPEAEMPGPDPDATTAPVQRTEPMVPPPRKPDELLAQTHPTTEATGEPPKVPAHQTAEPVPDAAEIGPRNRAEGSPIAAPVLDEGASRVSGGPPVPSQARAAVASLATTVEDASSHALMGGRRSPLAAPTSRRPMGRFFLAREHIDSAAITAAARDTASHSHRSLPLSGALPTPAPGSASGGSAPSLGGAGPDAGSAALALLLSMLLGGKFLWSACTLLRPDSVYGLIDNQPG